MKLDINIDNLIIEYNNLHKKGISELLSESPQLDELSEKEFIGRVADIVIEEIKTRSANSKRLIDGEKLTERHITAINKAILEQIFYTAYAGDYSLIVGFNPDQNSVISLSEMRARQFSPLALKILTNAGLFYAGLDGSPRFSYLDGW